MMRKILIIGCFSLFFCLQSHAQTSSAFEEMRDSLLISMKKLILEDLSNDSIVLEDRPWWKFGIGESFVLEVVFLDEKTSYIIMTMNPTKSMTKKYIKQKNGWKIKKNALIYTFEKNINEYNGLRYDIIDHFSYRFLILFKKDVLFGSVQFNEFLGDALYGEYKFKAQKEGLTIMEKQIEILQGEDAVKQKYNMCF